MLDTVVFSQFRYPISPMVLKMVLGKRAGDIFQFSTKNIIFAIGFVILSLLLQLLFHFIARKVVERKNDYDPTLLIKRYKNSVHYVDHLIGKVIQKLEDKKLLENTIIVITSDHGQEFNDLKKGYWQHGSNFGEYQIKVPMMIFDALKLPRTESKLTLHYDLAPTILKNYLGVQNNFSDYSFGEDLFKINANRKFFICGYNQKYALIENKQITTISPSGALNVYNKKLNKLDDENINYNLVLQGIQSANKFYKKKINDGR